MERLHTTRKKSRINSRDRQPRSGTMRSCDEPCASRRSRSKVPARPTGP